MAKWINVNDRLPDRNGVYLVYCPKALAFRQDKEKIYTSSYHEEFGWGVNHAVSHWQPLPQLPED